LDIFFFQAEDGIRDGHVTGVQTCALPIFRGELASSGHLNPALFEGRKRGVIFDVGHGATSFAWQVAEPAIKEQFLPDSISSDFRSEERRVGKSVDIGGRGSTI